MSLAGELLEGSGRRNLLCDRGGGGGEGMQVEAARSPYFQVRGARFLVGPMFWH